MTTRKPIELGDVITRSRISEMPVLRRLMEHVEHISNLDGVTSVSVYPVITSDTVANPFLVIGKESETGIECVGYQGIYRQIYFIAANEYGRRAVSAYLRHRF